MPPRQMTRRTAALILCFALAACATPPPGSAVSDPFCRAGDLAFHTDFEAAALHGCAAGQNGPVLTVGPEYAPINPSPWYAWRVTSESEAEQSRVAVTVTQRYVHGWHRYAPWISVDGENWQRLEDARVSVADDGTASFSLDVPPGGLFVAAQPPLTSAAMERWAGGLAAANGLEAVEVAESVEGRPIAGYVTALSGRRHSVVLISRQHPPEVTGGVAFQDFVGRLFAEDGLARRFRERFAIGLVPEVNPDGVTRGYWRTNARGVDLNRDWGPFTQPETRGVSAWLLELDQRVPLRLFIDFHSTQQDVFYMPHATDDPEPAGFAAAWRDRLGQRLGNDMPAWSGEHNPGLPTSKSWVHKEYGVVAMTYEVGDNTPRDRIRRVATAAAEETMKLLLDIEGEAP